MLNVHGSLLPRWRGAAPIVYALLNRDAKTGVTIMRIRPKHFDVGEIVSQREVEIPPNIKMPDLHSHLAHVGAEELILTLRGLPHNLDKAKPQPTEGVTFAPRVTQKMAQIDWNKMSSDEVCNLDSALTGMFPLQSSFSGQVVKLYNISKCIACGLKETKPGSAVYDNENKTIRIVCADGQWISVSKIGVHGKKVMSATEFANGYMRNSVIVFH